MTQNIIKKIILIDPIKNIYSAVRAKNNNHAYVYLFVFGTPNRNFVLLLLLHIPNHMMQYFGRV